ncbi:MAG: four-carbon acid sugar kinase family protein [Mycetocola sp.]
MLTESAALAAYPAEVPVDAATVAAAADAQGRVQIVLDDDPTGTQSVSNLPVLSAWERSDLEWALDQNTRAVYVLTNTRSLDEADAAERNRQIVTVATEVAAERGITLSFVSRGDSTLRGHYPLETTVIDETVRSLGQAGHDGVVIVPAFPDAGRITIGGVHYLRGANDSLTPAGESEFARDATFGYRSSSLADWVEEKTGGAVAATDVLVLDLTTIRAGADAIAAALGTVSGGQPVVVDIVTENDLRLLALGLIAAENAGARLLYRVGPPFVRGRIGQEQHAPLTAHEVYGPAGGADNGGLVVVGSHVGQTTRQLAELSRQGGLADTIEIDIAQVLDGTRSTAHIADVVARAADALGRGTVVVHTSRTLVKTDDPEESLTIARRVSTAVVQAVQGILERNAPRFVIAKGGITSSDVASRGLGIRAAIVRGPMLPGIVSLWEPVGGPASGIPYVVFAGNVGTDESLADVVRTLALPQHRPAAQI